MSYNIIEDDNSLFIEILSFIQTIYPYYNKNKLEDNYSNIKYSIQMIQKSLNNVISNKDLLKVIIFDTLIGNSDRHHSNLAVIAKGTSYKENEIYNIKFEYKLSPLYDNGSSLCSYVNEEDINTILKDKMKFESLINTKSKSAIGYENERPIRHFDLLQKIKDNYYDDTIKIVTKIRDNINENSVDKILNEFDSTILSEDMKKLLKIYLLERRKRILDIYDLKDEV